ncbi:Scr1 family TA system antitoxin-like transcriptional regulator [Nocardiopsis algeriensis]|uniref:Scr1 family TA system antitoxin-like transcriptional regulator n=1 Tax=Nocardiopsis algeriensis TaxID=1478215 RepID=UPI001FE2E46B|nr:Scr1 family TA system antitoxin-like transcriptional regulator [Nocardiopsis algeriensis]
MAAWSSATNRSYGPRLHSNPQDGGPRYFPEDPSCVYLETSGVNTLFLEEDDDVRQHELLYDYAQASALSVDDSMAFIAEVLESVT